VFFFMHSTEDFINNFNISTYSSDGAMMADVLFMIIV